MAGCRRSLFVAKLVAVAVFVMVSGIVIAQPPGSSPPLPLLPGSDPGGTLPQPSGPPVGSAPAPLTPPLANPQPVPIPANPILPPAAGPQPVPISQPPFPQQRFNIPKILPNMPTKSLLPTAPKMVPITGPVLTDDLRKVPEAEFEARPEKITNDGKLVEQAAYQLAKISHMNAKKTDAFMVALLENRPDLSGLPFVMGDDCRTSGERTKQFTIAVNTVRQALAGRVIVNDVNTGFSQQGTSPQPGGPMQGFWSRFNTTCEQEDANRGRTDKVLAEHVTLARIAALMQMLAPESAEIRLGLVKYLAGIPHVESSKALARMAIFSTEDDVRDAAITALKVRREKDYTDVLVKGLRYPWPAVAKRAADAITKLERKDLIPELVAVLDETDPRMPKMKEVNGKKVAVVREMVKVNHHRNCMMCHPPGNPNTMTSNAITAEVPILGQSLPTPSQGYQSSTPELMVRIDVTYLRQDFSVMLPVGEAHPWPEMQRFDFLVRERTLTTDEAAIYRDKLTPKERGVLSPYHKAALAALREITGKDTAPTADAWRKLLDL
ncbi:MAG: hypothetical protein L0241_17250 [Planctomycetia bacterium]|nr:hypothetical protein [Planctomycetia bacterium]